MIRSLLAAILGVLATIVIPIIALPILVFDRGGPLSNWLTRVWARWWLWLAGVEVETFGTEKIDPTRGYVFMANHQSHFDIPITVSALPANLKMPAKKELFRIPIFGWAMWLTDHIVIDRENRTKAIRSLATGEQRIKRGRSILIYPEGTRSPDGKIGAFKKGGFHMAVKAGATVFPVIIIGSRGILPKHSLKLNPGKVKVFVEDPIEMSDVGGNRDELSQRVETAIRTRFEQESG